MNRSLLLFGILLMAFFIGESGCYKNEPIPAADFTFSGNNQFYVPCNVIFTNRSVNAFSYEWWFGDDSTSTEKDPSHTYLVPGKFEIRLRAYTESRDQWASQSKFITIKDTVL